MKKIYVVTGFLGSGKTTFINEFLYPFLEKTNLMIIENEFGKLGIDGQILNKPKVKVKELYSGCVCCSLAIELYEIVKFSFSKNEADIAVLETSGISRTSDLKKILKKIEDEKIAKVEKIINIIDIYNFEEYIENFGHFFIDQIEQANLLLCSHIEDSLKKEELKTKIQKYNDKAILVFKDFKKLKLNELEEILNLNQKETNILLKYSPEKSKGQNINFESISIEKMKNFNKIDFIKNLKKLKSLNKGICLRAKGFIKLESEIFHFEYSNGVIDMEKKSGLYSQSIVIIGVNLDKNELEEMFK